MSSAEASRDQHCRSIVARRQNSAALHAGSGRCLPPRRIVSSKIEWQRSV